ncbi:hypothetical protein KLEP7_gp75 [Pseudaeromonas phage vB_PpeM_ KLEP7]|nr:hypothetical protein KLEP7_gp75 [Pseudaeromonas phage vB_PpeM_ KLEP7]
MLHIGLITLVCFAGDADPTVFNGSCFWSVEKEYQTIQQCEQESKNYDFSFVPSNIFIKKKVCDEFKENK